MTAGDTLLSTLGIIAVAVGIGLGGGDRPRRNGAAGLLLLGLALAAWRAGAPAGAGPAPVGRLSQGFLVGNGGLLLVGALLVALAALRSAPDRFRLPARAFAAVGLALLAPVVAAFVAAAGPLRASGAALALGLVATSVAVGLRAVFTRAPVRRLAQRVARPPLAPVLHAAPGLHLAALGAGLFCAGLAPHLGALFIAVPVVAWAGYLGFHESADRPVPVAPVLTLLLLPAYWLLATVSGPVGLGTDMLHQVPMSPAAELLVAPALLLAGWAASGLWPLQRQLPGALAAPAGALLLARAGLPLVAEGLEYWRPLTVPVVWLGLWNAAAHRRWPLLVAGAGVLALVGGGTGALAPAAGLLATGLALELTTTIRAGPVTAAAARVVAWVTTAVCGALVLEEALRGEVVYTALGVLGLVLVVASAGEAAPAR